MKKIVVLLALSSFALVNAAAPSIKQDTRFPRVYYNTQSFPRGLFSSEDGSTLTPGPCFNNALFAWDLNGVIFNNESSWFKGMWKMAVTEGYGWSYTFEVAGKANKLMKNRKEWKKSGDPRGHVWDAILFSLETSTDLEEQKLARILRAFTSKANSLNYETVDILRELARNGHTNVVLSNMGSLVLRDQVTFLRNELENNQELTSAEKQAIRFAIDFLTNHERNVIAAPENNWLYKPLPAIYQTSISKNPLLNAEGMPKKRMKIFIDDKLENIIAALGDGFFDIAIMFTNARDLREILSAISDSRLCALNT